jgi:ATP-dependent exoDNAse (exonuclease V) beta subunit
VWAIRGKTPKEVASNFVEALRSLKEQEIIESYAQCALLAYSLKPRQEANLYIRKLKEQGIPLTFSSSPKDQPVYQQILGTLLIALDRSGNLIPANFAQNNASLARYVEECRQAAQADPVLSAMARQINTWLLSHEDAARVMSLTTLAQRILNAQPCIEAIQQDKAAEMAIHTLIQTLDSYDRIVEHGYRIALEESQGKKRVKKWWMERVYRILVEGVQQEQLERGEEPQAPLPTDAMSVLTIHKAKGLEFPVVAVVVDECNRGQPGATHRLEEDVLPFRQDRALSKDATPTFLLGGDGEARAVQDLVRLHYVAYSRAQSVLLLLIPDDHLKSLPPAIGLGTDAAWFRQQVEEWPPRPQKTRRSKSDAAVAREGVEQHELW